MARRIVIVGGVAGGMSAATRLRRLDEQAEIVVLERGEHVSFANCGLPYYVGGVIADRESLLLQTPGSLGARFALDVRVNSEATAIDTQAQTVSVRGPQGDYQLSYDELILAPGASPFVPPVPGIERALTLRNVADVDAMVAAVSDTPREAVILGAGFIGLEVAENLRHRGIGVTVIELADQVLAPLDPEMAVLVQRRLEAEGVAVRLGVSATEITPDAVILSDGSRIPAGLVVAAIGVRPDSTLASSAGIETTERGGIVVDSYQRTSAPHVYAVGDAAVKRDAISGQETLVPLAQTANRHGRLVADVICRGLGQAKPVLGTAVVGIFGMTAAVTGWNEKRARAAGREITVIHTHPFDHAGYYPGAEQMALKLIVDRHTQRILGAQGVGGAGVDKRIDVIATAMRAGLSASDLADLELAYAPQFGSAKDPVNMLGFVAENIVTGLSETIQWHELAAAQASGASVIDVRTPAEFAGGALPGAINIPLDELRERLDELPDGELIVNCAVGVRGHTALRILAGNGRSARNLDGGYRTWASVN
ncbi:MAG: FAD-dependent oxidoreductase [Propionibacteriaceae bacterium]|nr:FAD-dependent oxidoreductase [Propionibacteriaceae bacterium]